MSIARMVSLGLDRQQEAAAVAPSERQTRGIRREADSSTARNTVDSAMNKIAAFIPSEVIGVYVAGFGILSPDTETAKWWVFGISLALIPLFMGLNYLAERKRSRTDPDYRIAFVLMILAIVAFVAWAAAMPATPFLAMTPHATTIGGWAVVILAGILYKVADLLDVVPKAR